MRKPTEVFRSCMQLLAGAYGREFTQAAMDAYWLVLGKLDDERMREAFRRAMSEERYCPAPAVIKAYAVPARQAGQQERKIQEPTPEQWAEIRMDISRIKGQIADALDANAVLGDGRERDGHSS